MVDVGRQYRGHRYSLAVDDHCPPPLNFIVPGVGLPRHTESVLILRLQMPVWVHDAHLLRPH